MRKHPYIIISKKKKKGYNKEQSVRTNGNNCQNNVETTHIQLI